MAYRSRTFPATVNNVTGDELDLLSKNNVPSIPAAATTPWNAVTRLAYGTVAFSNPTTPATFGLTGLTPATGNLFPANVLVTGCWYEVDVTLTTAGGDAGTLAFEARQHGYYCSYRCQCWR